VFSFKKLRKGRIRTKFKMRVPNLRHPLLICLKEERNDGQLRQTQEATSISRVDLHAIFFMATSFKKY